MIRQPFDLAPNVGAIDDAHGEQSTGGIRPLTSFSPEFFLAEGEPYDRSDLALNKRGRPVSVWSAIQVMHDKKPERWKDMAREVFGLNEKDAELLMGEAVLDKIQETNTCSSLGTPVAVWIDSEGVYRIEVFEAD